MMLDPKVIFNVNEDERELKKQGRGDVVSTWFFDLFYFCYIFGFCLFYFVYLFLYNCSCFAIIFDCKMGEDEDIGHLKTT